MRKFFLSLTIAVSFIASCSIFGIVDNTEYKKNIEAAFNYCSFGKDYKPQYFKGVNDMEIAYDVIGSESAKYAIVLLPGMGEAFVKYSEFIYDMERLTGNNIKFYLMDHVGQGFSERFETETADGEYVDKFEDYVNNMHIFLTTIVGDGGNKSTDNQNRPVFLIAHSMGGGISAMFLEKYHGYFQAVVLSSPMIDPKTLLETWMFNDITKLLAKGACNHGKAKYYGWGQGPRTKAVDKVKDSHVTNCQNRSDNWEKTILGDPSNEIVYPGLYPKIAIGGATWGWLLESLTACDGISKIKNLDKISDKVLLLMAGDDTVVSRIAEKKFKGHVKDCTLIKFKKAKHELLMETDDIRGNGIEVDTKNPKTVIDNILNFFQIPIVPIKNI